MPNSSLKSPTQILAAAAKHLKGSSKQLQSTRLPVAAQTSSQVKTLAVLALATSVVALTVTTVGLVSAGLTKSSQRKAKRAFRRDGIGTMKEALELGKQRSEQYRKESAKQEGVLDSIRKTTAVNLVSFEKTLTAREKAVAGRIAAHNPLYTDAHPADGQGPHDGNYHEALDKEAAKPKVPAVTPQPEVIKVEEQIAVAESKNTPSEPKPATRKPAARKPTTARPKSTTAKTPAKPQKSATES